MSSVDGSGHFEALIAEADQLLSKRELQRAKAVLERALAIQPNDLNVRNRFALCVLQLGQLEDALALYQSVEAELPDSVHAKVNLALVLLKLGRASAARPLLERAIELSPGHRRAWGYLGIVLEQLGQYEEAERALLTGHYATAASRLRERHPHDATLGAIRSFSAESARAAMPVVRHSPQTLPPNAIGPLLERPAAPTLGVSQLRRFNTTLRPPELVVEQPVAATVPPPSISQPAMADYVEEIPAEVVVAPPPRPTSPDDGGGPKPTRPILPLLDTALASLLVPPSEATVGVHPSGLVIVSLVESATPEGGFAARLDCLQAAVGALRPAPMPRQDPRRDPFAAQPFASGGAPVGRFVGSGQLVLRPRPGRKLLPFLMNADVAFIREELVVAFDHALQFDLGRMRLSETELLSLVRFRGDGAVVLGLTEPFLAFDVRGEHAITLRADTLVGWIGLLGPEPTDPWYPGGPATEFITLGGEGTVLFT